MPNSAVLCFSFHHIVRQDYTIQLYNPQNGVLSINSRLLDKYTVSHLCVDNQG